MPEEVELQHPDLVRLHHLWLQKSPHGQLPSRGMFDTAELHFMLGYIMLLDLVGKRRFRVRLHGSRLVDEMRYDHSGGFIDEWPYQPTQDLLLQQCRAAVEARRPLAVVAGELFRHKMTRCGALWLPLAADGWDVDMLMVGIRWS